MAFFPDKTIYFSEKNLPGYIHLVNINALDNIIIQGLYFSRNDKTEGSKLIIYFHGNSGNIYQRIDEAVRLYAMGYEVLLVSYRGYAGSQGSPSEKGIYIDGKSALSYGTDDLGYSISNIIIYGRSIGTSVAVDVSQKMNLSKLVLITPLSSGNDYAQSKGLGFMNPLIGPCFDSYDKINNVLCPLLVIHGDKDKVIPYEEGLKLFEKYNGIKKMVTITNADHNNLEHVDSDLYYSSIKEFLSN